MNHDSSKTNWKSFLNFEFIFDIRASTYFNIYDSWNTQPQNVVCILSAVNITWDIKNFVQISILLNKTKIVEIWTKILYISGFIESDRPAM